MADWFKFFENDLDEIRFQWAVHQLSGVCPVWVGILSECCRHKSDTIRWNDSDHEIWGFGNRLNQTPEVVRESVKLLEKIEYVKREGNMLKVLKWKEKQSEYCQKKDRKNTKAEPENPPNTPESVRTVSGECPPRGEERRGEESIPPVVPQGGLTTGQLVALLQKEISKHYDRDLNIRWSALEEDSLLDVCRRHPNANQEWIELRNYAATTPKYFPFKIPRLLQDWDGLLDSARAAAKPSAKPWDKDGIQTADEAKARMEAEKVRTKQARDEMLRNK